METNETPIMQMNGNEKYYKIYIFNPINRAEVNFEYRVITKELENGKLELISYNFKIFNGDPIKSSVVQATDIAKMKLPEIIRQILEMTGTNPEEMREIDLSDIKTFSAQMSFLEELSGINEEYLI